MDPSDEDLRKAWRNRQLLETRVMYLIYIVPATIFTVTVTILTLPLTILSAQMSNTVFSWLEQQNANLITWLCVTINRALDLILGKHR